MKLMSARSNPYLKPFICLLYVGFGLSSHLTFAKTDDSLAQPKNSIAHVRKDSVIISIPKDKSGNYRIVMSKGNLQLAINRNGTYVLRAKENSFEYEIFASANRVGALVSTLTKQYDQDSEMCIPSTDPMKKISDEVIGAIQTAAYSSSLLGEGCDELDAPDKKKLLDSVTKTFNAETSYLKKCLTSDTAKEAGKKNGKVADAILLASTQLEKNFDEVSSRKGSLKIQCSADTKPNYDAKANTINLPIEDGSLLSNPCKTTEQILAHEIFHQAGIEEASAKYLDTICAKNAAIESLKNPSCKNDYPNSLKTEGGAAASAIQESMKKAVKAEREKIAPVLVAEIKTAEFVPVQDSDIQEITNPTSSGAYQASVDRVYNSMSSNMEKMAAPLNRAIASTVTTARAEKSASSTTNERSISKTTIAGLRQPASAKSNGNEEYVVEEILADKYNVPVSEVRAAAVAAGFAAPGSSTTQTVETRSARSPATAAPGAGGNEIAGGIAGPGGGQASTASTGGSSPTAGGVPGRSVSSGARGNSRLPASAGSQAAATDPLVEQLGQFNEVRGRRYQQIQERYDDPTFEPELKAKNIAIEYRRNNKTTIIGETSNSSSRTLFRDDGTVLKKISGAK